MLWSTRGLHMTPDAFRHLSADQVRTFPPLLRALWHEAHGDWTAAHEFAQDVDTPEGARVHAYLHRKEGDRTNAAYWYRRAGQSIATGPLEGEWETLVAAFLP